MADTFYDPGEQRAAKVNELFAAIASRYDRINDWQSFGLHRVWKRRLIRLAGVRPGDRALDVCCGTGDLALALAQQGARVIGLDFNSAMLDVARQKQIAQADRAAKNTEVTSHAAAAKQSPAVPQNPEFIQSDAQKIPFADGSFEVVTIGYGLRNLADREGGLREMWRVLKPGGRLLVLDFGKPDNAIWRWIYFGYLKLFVPLLGRVFCGNAAAYAYILESLQTYPAQAGVAAKLRELNFTHVRVINLLGGVMSIHYAER